MATPAQSGSQVVPPKPQADILPTLFGEGYGIYEVRKGSFVISFLLNTLGIVSLVASRGICSSTDMPTCA